MLRSSRPWFRSCFIHIATQLVFLLPYLYYPGQFETLLFLLRACLRFISRLYASIYMQQGSSILHAIETDGFENVNA